MYNNKKYYLDSIFDNFFKDDEILKTDISEEENGYLFEIDVPGIKKENIKVEYEQGYLKVKVLENDTKNEENKNYLRKERRVSALQRSYYIGNINENDIKANFNNGLLVIRVPKEERKSSSITINLD